MLVAQQGHSARGTAAELCAAGQLLSRSGDLPLHRWRISYVPCLTGEHALMTDAELNTEVLACSFRISCGCLGCWQGCTLPGA